MTKIAIISQPEQGVLIDIGGCDTVQEATQHLSSTFQVANQFWEDQPVDLNLGNLRLSKEEMAQVLSILSERGVNARQFFAKAELTCEALAAHNIQVTSGTPGSTPAPTCEPGKNAQSEAPEQTTAASENNSVSTETTATCETKVKSDAAPETEDAAAKETEATDAAPAIKEPAAPAAPHVLYLRQTLRSGQSVSHKGHLVIIGDVNPGAEVMAEGDITIWGALRGVAHAGTGGNTNCEIRALKFDPIQLRIAHAIARSPDRPRASLRTSGPETARIVGGTIRISSSAPE